MLSVHSMGASDRSRRLVSGLFSLIAWVLLLLASFGVKAVPTLSGDAYQSVYLGYPTNGLLTISWTGGDLGALLESQTAAYVESNATNKTSYSISAGARSYSVAKNAGVYYYTGFIGLCPSCAFTNDIIAIVYKTAPSITAWSTAYAGNPLQISWTAAPPATGYLLEQQFNGGAWTTLYNGGNTSFTTTGLVAGTYNFRVRPCWIYACAGFTGPTFTTSVLSPPGLTGGDYQSVYIGYPANGSFTVGWTGGDLDALLEAKTAPYAQPSATNKKTYAPVAGARSYTLTGMTAGVYYYTGFLGLCGNCAATNDITVIAYDEVPVITAPATNNTGAFNLTWTTVTNGGLYWLEQQVDGGAWTTLTPTTTTSYSATGLLSGTYNFRVHACWFYICAPFTSSVKTTVVSVPPPPTTLVAPATSTIGTYSLSWLAAQTATSYQVDQSLNYGAWTTIYSGAALGTNVFGNANGLYQYRVRACNQNGCSADSAAQNTSVLLPPNPPASLSVPSSTSGQLSATWPASATATGYELDRRLNGGAWSTVFTGGATTTTLSALATGIHDFRVRACNTSGCGAYSVSATSYVNVAPPTPGAISGPNPNGGTFTLGWGAAPGTDTYKLQEKVGSGSWATIATPATSSFKVIGRGAGTYSYQVQSCNVVGCSAFTAAFTTVAVVPVTPTGLSAPANSNSAVYAVSWNGQSVALTYELQMSAGGGSWVNIYTGSAASRTMNSQSGSYSFQVRACNAVGCSSYSAPVSVVVNVQNTFTTAINPSDDADTQTLYTGAVAGDLSVGPDGSANYVVPIEVPPGIHGEKPKISLVYNSNSGNSLVGWGWDIGGLSRIQRCNATKIQDGYYSGTTHSSAYKYCLDGQRLVQIGVNEYRTEAETFTKITVTASANNLPVTWLVQTRDGHRYIYGGTADSRREDDDSNGAGKIIGWYLNRSEDKSANAIDYIYAYNRTAGTHRISAIEYTKNALATSVRNRMEFNYETRDDVIDGYASESRYVIDQRLSNISVYSTVSGSYQLLRKYQLAYKSWNGSSEADPAKTSRVASVKVCYGNDTVCSALTTFDWTSTAADQYKFELVSYPVLGAGQLYPAAKTPDALARYDYFRDGQLYEPVKLVGDTWRLWNRLISSPQATTGLVIATLPETQYTYTYEWEIGNGWHGGGSGSGSSSVWTTTSADSVDFNGDGLKDIYFVDNVGSRGVVAYLNSGSAFNYSPSYSLIPDQVRYTATHRVAADNQSSKLTGPTVYRLAFLDMNGDGLVDVFRRPTFCQGCTSPNNRTDVSVALNTGNGLGAFGPWTTTAYFPELENTWRTLLQDMNGDGLPDLVGWNGSVAISSGSAFTSIWSAPANLFPAGYNPDARSNVEYISSYREFTIADINGDGLPDMADVRPEGVLVSLNDGTKMLPATIWSQSIADPYWRTQNPGVDLPPRYAIMDMNADGKADIIRYGTTTEVAFSKGRVSSATSFDGFSSFVDYGAVQPFYAYVEPSHRTVSAFPEDVNMDGIPEPYGGTCYFFYVGSPFPGAACVAKNKQYRIVAVNDGSRAFSLTYANLSADDAYIPVYSSTSNEIADLAWIGNALTPTYSGGSEGGQGKGLIAPAYDNNRTAGRFGVKALTVTDSSAAVTKQYSYKGLKNHRTGWGSLGFAEVKEVEFLTPVVAPTAPIRVTTSRFAQAASSQYRLGGQLLSRTEEVTGPNATSLVKVNEVINQLDVKVWQDDLDAGLKSPHYQVIPSASQTNFYSYETGALTHRRAARQRIENTNDIQCSIVAAFPLVYTAGTAQDTVYDNYGNLLKEQVSTCEADGKLSVVRTDNLGFDDASVLAAGNYVLGLVNNQQKKFTLYNAAGGVVGTKQTTTTRQHNASGKLTRKTLEPNTALEFVTQYSNFNAYGTPGTTTESWPDDADDGLAFNQRVTSQTEVFEQSGKRTVTTSQPVNHVDGSVATLSKTAVYGGRFGELASTTDWNNWLTTWQYDALGREIQEDRHDGTQTLTRWRNCVSCLGTSAYFVHTKTSGEAPQRAYFDTSDRKTGARSTAMSGQYVYTKRAFDGRGRLQGESSPYTGSAPAYNTTYAYDLLDREKTVTSADGGLTQTSYDGLVKTVSNPLNQTTIFTYNGLDQLIKSTDAANTIAIYSYNPQGELNQVSIDNAGDSLPAVVISANYDVFRRPTQITDPDSGITQLKYNALDSVARKTDANNTVTTYQFDELGRQIRRIWDASTANPGNRTSSWLYDTATSGIGKLARLNGFDTKGRPYEAVHTYDGFGNPETETRTIAGQTFAIKYYYDAFGRKQGLKYPGDGLNIGYGYGSHGHLVSMFNARQPANEARTLRLVTADDVWGNVTSESYANGVGTTRSYRADNGRLSSIVAIKSGLSIVDQVYDFDKLGNLSSRIDNRGGVSQYFCYDNLNRLTAARPTSCSPSDSDYSYDAIGNLLKKVPDITSATYSSARPHAVAQVVIGGQTLNYTYDNAGRLTSRNGSAVVYAPFGKPTSMSGNGKTTEIVYGPDEERIQRIDGAVTTTYFDKLFEKIEDATSVTRNYYVGDFALFTDIAAGTGSDWYWLYLNRDHIGSIVAETNGNPQTTADINWQAYEPWGRPLSGTWSSAPSNQLYFTQRGFTDHEHLQEVGLIHMNGRVYDPILGRFLSPDPVPGSAGDAQTFNRYSYVLNNPLAYTDPTGYSPEDDCGCVVVDGRYGLDAIQIRYDFSQFQFQTFVRAGNAMVNQVEQAAQNFAFRLSLYVVAAEFYITGTSEVAEALYGPWQSANSEADNGGGEKGTEEKGKSKDKSKDKPGGRRKNRVPDKGEAGTIGKNDSDTTRKKYGEDGWVEKEWNRGHASNNSPLSEQEDHVHEHKPNPHHPEGRPTRQPARPPTADDLNDFGF